MTIQTLTNEVELPLQWDERATGWIVRDIIDERVWVIPLANTDRVAIGTPGTYAPYDHAWCYAKGGTALLAALGWDPTQEAEPPGFIKRVMRQRALPDDHDAV